MFNVGFNRFGSTPPVVKNLIYINVIMFIATWVFQSRGIDLSDILGLQYFKSPLFHPYQIVTHMFMHANLSHIFFNMFALWMFGKILESVWGSQRFFIYYIITGLGAAAVHTLVNYIHYSQLEAAVVAFTQNPTLGAYKSLYFDHFQSMGIDQLKVLIFDNSNYSPEKAINLSYQMYYSVITIPTVGASGAVFGVLLAFGMLFPNTELMLLFPPIPIKAKWFVLGYGAIELISGLQQPGSNIAHFAHLGGMLFGYIMIKYWKTKRSNFY